VIQKSFVPDQFMAEFRRVVLRQEPARDILVSIVTNDMRPEIITAVQQTIGVLSNQTVMEMARDKLDNVQPDMWAKAELSNEDAVFSICMGGANGDLRNLAMAIVGSGEDNDVSDVLQETVNTMVGRIRASLGERGIMMAQSATTVSREAQVVSEDRGIAVPFTTESGTRFLMSLMVEEKTANV